MSGNGEVKDPIAEAIAAVEAPKPQVLKQFDVTIASTGRSAAVALPEDATDGELAELAGWMLSALLAHFRAERMKQPASRIIVPRH